LKLPLAFKENASNHVMYESATELSSSPLNFSSSSVTSDCVKSSSLESISLSKKNTFRHCCENDAKLQVGILDLSSVDCKKGWEGTFLSNWRENTSGKTCFTARAHLSFIHQAGLRWWISPNTAIGKSGLLCQSYLFKNPTFSPDNYFQALQDIAFSTSCDEEEVSKDFPLLSTNKASIEFDYMARNENKSFVALSLQRWPPKKIEIREKERSKGMGIGVSPAALQEVHLLNQLHTTFPAPRGHINIVNPLAIARNLSKSDKKFTNQNIEKDATSFYNSPTNIFDKLAMSKDSIYFSTQDISTEPQDTTPHLVFEPFPLVLQNLMSKPSKKEKALDGPLPSILLIAWFYDLLSSIAHCHSQHLILRTIHPDQIFIDQCGVAKLSGISRAIALSPDERGKFIDPFKTFKEKGKKYSGSISNDDVLTNPYIAPEILLGATRYTQQSDIWTLGCLMSHLLLSKTLFSGRDRRTKLQSIFKIVGTPSSQNYKKAEAYPYYEKCKLSATNNIDKKPKKYRKDVSKALKYILNANATEHDKYNNILGLLELMLDLDPEKRISAKDALDSNFLSEYKTKIKCDEFHQEFAKEWLSFKEKFSKDQNSYIDHHDDKESKRKAFLLQASDGTFESNEEFDSLYNFTGPVKKMKL